MKTHYATCDKANESDNNDYWSETACGLEETEAPMTDNLKYVTCKNCIKKIKKLKFMIENGLGWEDMKNDISPMHEI